MGEANNPGPPRQRGPEEILNELEATLTRLDSSDEEPLLRPCLAGMLCGGFHTQWKEASVIRFKFRGRLFWPSVQEPHGLCRTVRATGSPFWQQIRLSTIVPFHIQFPEAGVLGQSATLLDDLECDLTKVDTNQVRVESRQRVPCRPTVCAMSQGSGSDTESLTTLCTNPPGDASCWCHQERQQSKVHKKKEGDVVPREARAADFFIKDVAKRVGAVPMGSPLPKTAPQPEVVAIERSSDVGRYWSAGFQPNLSGW